MKRMNDYESIFYLFNMFYDDKMKILEDAEAIEETIRKLFQEKNPDAIIERVVLDLHYAMFPTIENTLKIYVHYKEEEEQ